MQRVAKESFMKKGSRKYPDDIRPEYDFASMKGGVRGKYVKRLREGTNLALAATHEAVPVHDWQKQELARRKANLLKNLASGLSWEEVKRRVRER